MKLEGKVAIVTGASAGIGRAIATLFAKEGAVVYAVARRTERLKMLQENTKDYAGKVIPYSADLRVREQSERIIDLACKDQGKLDILVNNAGVMDDFSPIGEVSDEMMQNLTDINVMAPFYSTRKAINCFLRQGEGNIINVSSIGGLNGARAGAAYTMSKHAIIGLTKNTGFMYAKKNIRCNAICPGGVDTEVGSGEYMKDLNQTGIDVIMPSTCGNPRSGKSEEIATIALFLATDDSSFINGECIVGDSGWTAF